MAEIHSFTLDLENKGLLISRPGDVLPPGYLTSYLNLTANKTGFIESRGGTSRVSGTNLGSAVNSLGRIILRERRTSIRALAQRFIAPSVRLRPGFLAILWSCGKAVQILLILSHEIVFDSLQRMKDNGTTTILRRRGRTYSTPRC